jgi:hypothetical protein
MKTSLKAELLLLMATVALFAVSIFNVSQLTTNNAISQLTTNNATETLTANNIISLFVIEEEKVIGKCAYIRGRLDTEKLSIPHNSIYVIHCMEKIYIFAELQLQS